MKMVHIGWLVVLICTAQFSFGLESRKRSVLSELQAMSHGYHSAAEWERVMTELQRLRVDAERSGDHEMVVESVLIESMVYSDMRGRTGQAIEILQGIKKRYYGKPVEAVRRVYARLAEVYAMDGNEQAINDLIQEFKQSPHYDPEVFPFEGGWGREVPLSVTRPLGGNDSITMAIMQRYRAQARYARGAVMPPLQGTGFDGQPVRLTDLRGRVVLLDFWVPGWPAWSRDLSLVRQVYEQHQRAGFIVLGIPLGGRPEAIQNAIRENRIPWPHMQVPRQQLGPLGIFGEPQNILVDRHGVIIARNIPATRLAEAVQAALTSR